MLEYVIQANGWYMVLVSYWIVHQTANYSKKKFSLPLALLRGSVGLLAVVQAGALIFGYLEINLAKEGFLAVSVVFNIILTSTVIFHKSRFQQL